MKMQSAQIEETNAMKAKVIDACITAGMIPTWQGDGTITCGTKGK